MSKDFLQDSRSPGGLAPSQPDYHWKPVSAATSSRVRKTESGEWPSSAAREYTAERDPYQDEWAYDDAPVPPTPPQGRQHYADPAPPAWERQDWGEEDCDTSPVSDVTETLPAAVPPRQPVRVRREPVQPKRMSAQDLLMQEVGQLLIDVIRLHQGEWKLASIRANEEKDRLEAFLIPQNKRMELKEAIHRNQYMVITVDRHGNTKIREPKKHGPLRRFTRWLFGSD